MRSRFHVSRAARWLLPIACLSAAVALTAPGSAATSRSQPVNALILGKVLACGGPKGGPRCPVQHHSVVSAFGPGDRLVARETITNGHFSFWVRAGKFTLVARRPHCCHGETSVRAEPNETVHANIVYSLAPINHSN